VPVPSVAMKESMKATSTRIPRDDLAAIDVEAHALERFVPPNDLATFSKRKMPPCAKSRSSLVREP
jgi:hypothetical protein